MMVDWDRPRPDGYSVAALHAAAKARLAREATGFARAGMLFLERPHRWRAYDREIWQCGDAFARQALGEYCIRQQRAGRTEIPLAEIAHVRAGIALALEMVPR